MKRGKRTPLAVAVGCAGVMAFASGAATEDPQRSELGWLGFIYRYVDDEPTGIFSVTVVYDDTPAASAGLRVGDEILRVNDAPFRFEKRAGELVRAFDWVRPRDRVELLIRRNGEEEKLALVAAPMTDEGWRSREGRLTAAGGYELEELANVHGALRVYLGVDDGEMRFVEVRKNDGTILRVSSDVERFLEWFPLTHSRWEHLAPNKSLVLSVQPGLPSPRFELLESGDEAARPPPDR